MENVLNEILETAQKTTDNILIVINPMSYWDSPFVAYALKTVLDAIVKDMDDGQRAVYDAMGRTFGSESWKVCISASTEEALKNFDSQGGGIVNGI